MNLGDNLAGKVIIDTERCKGCGLCVPVCPKNDIVISERSNKKGYFPAQAKNRECTGCAMCAVICPEAAIKVMLDDGIVAIEPGHKTKVGPIKEKV